MFERAVLTNHVSAYAFHEFLDFRYHCLCFPGALLNPCGDAGWHIRHKRSLSKLDRLKFRRQYLDSKQSQ